jgi:FtsP/CotA-like multicopper oxidase with cupredoxin domain
MIRTRIIKLIGLGLLLTAVALLRVSAPVQAEPQVPLTDQGIPSVLAAPQPPPAEVASQPAAPAAQASHTFNLCASDGMITLPDSTSVNVWGFVDTGGGTCTTGLVNSLPGPELRVNAGDSVTINLTNALAENVSILIPGQNVAATGDVAGTFTAEAGANVGTATYSFTAQEGTYLYESGTNASIQIPMGLYGALIVDSGVTGQAYSYAFDQEAVLLLSEIDPNLNANPGGFDLLDYHPTYWLINGVAYPNTAPITASPGERVLLRYLNAGFVHPSMTLLGAYQRVIAKEAYALTNPFDVVAETIPAGTTADMIVDTTGLGEMSVALYNRNMYVTNGDAYPGGMLTFLDISAPTGTPPTVDIVSPASGSTVFGDVVAVQIDAADVEDDANLGAGNLNVEWNVDGGAWQMASWTGTYYEATWDTTAVGDGAHTINARATDSDTDTTNDSNDVVVSNLPAVAIVAPAEGATIAGDMVLVQIDASDAEDDANPGAGNLTVTWDVDGGASAPATYNGVSGYYEAVLDTTLLAEVAHTINAQATDSRANAVTDSNNNVTVSNVPTANIVNPAEGATVSGSVTVQIGATDFEDDANLGVGNLTVSWGVGGDTSQSTTYNAGTGYYEATWDTSLTPDAVTINAQATDSRSNVATDSNNVTVGANSIHIGDLDGSSTPGGGPNWTATVMATVHAVDESPVEGATVTMEATRTRKSDGSAAVTTLTCVTDAAGQCSVSQDVTNQFENDVTFTVTNVTNAAPYQPADNHDPEGPDDSDGTTIVVQM